MKEDFLLTLEARRKAEKEEHLLLKSKEEAFIAEESMM